MGSNVFVLLPVSFSLFLDGLNYDHAGPEEVHLEVRLVGEFGSKMWFLCP